MKWETLANKRQEFIILLLHNQEAFCKLRELFRAWLKGFPRLNVFYAISDWLMNTTNNYVNLCCSKGGVLKNKLEKLSANRKVFLRRVSVTLGRKSVKHFSLSVCRRETNSLVSRVIAHRNERLSRMCWHSFRKLKKWFHENSEFF